MKYLIDSYLLDSKNIDFQFNDMRIDLARMNEWREGARKSTKEINWWFLLRSFLSCSCVFSCPHNAPVKMPCL